MTCMIHQHHLLPGQSGKDFQSPFFICFMSGPPQQPWWVSTAVFARILGRFLVGSCYHDNSRVCTAYRFYVEFVSNTTQIFYSITVKMIRNSYAPRTFAFIPLLFAFIPLLLHLTSAYTSFFSCFAWLNELFTWLTEWLADLLASWRTVWPSVGLTDWLVEWLTDLLIIGLSEIFQWLHKKGTNDRFVSHMNSPLLLC